MKNLFVCHSQAQLILAIGLAKGRFGEQTNNLILFKDFFMGEELKRNLNEIFNTVYIRKGGYPKQNKKWKKKGYRFISDLIFLKKTLISFYNKVFIICDQNLQELYIIKKTYILNIKTEFIWLEDGSYPYFLNIENKQGLNRNRFTVHVRQFIFKYFLQFGSIYSYEGNYMAGNKHLKTAYLTMPECARDIFKNKKLIKIEAKEYLIGIKSFFSNQKNIFFPEGDIIIVFDKFDTYEYLDQIKDICSYVIKVSKQKGKNVLFKLHPREEVANLEFLENAKELNRNFGFEFYISRIVESNSTIKVIGFKSTSLQVAKFFDLETISLFLLSGESNKELCDFYKKLNISLLKNIEKLEASI